MEAAIGSMTKAFAQSSKEAADKWMQFEEKEMKFEAEISGDERRSRVTMKCSCFRCWGRCSC